MPIDPVKEYDFLFRYENALCACGIDAKNVDYDALADVRHKFAKELVEKVSGVDQAVKAETQRIVDLLHEHYGYESAQWLLINQRTGSLIEQRPALQEVENLITHKNKSAKLLTKDHS